MDDIIMSQADQQRAFTGELVNLMTRYRCEFELTLASMIGCIEVAKTHLLVEIINEDEDVEGAE